ncbi:TetR/AcrR family transcriptional regulator [bacterium]|nr:TetR/AcrR family transcriptional regulator [bacterium]
MQNRDFDQTIDGQTGLIKAKRERSGESYERIIEVATVLFAQYGYHGLSTRKLADEVDLNIATVNYHVGGKQELYQEVFQPSISKGTPTA